MHTRTSLIAAARRRVRRAGWDVVRYPGSHPGHRRALLLHAQRTDLVVDVGANTGQYGRDLRWFGYTGQILSFEPMRDAYADLLVHARRDGRWDAVRSALGTESGEVTINVAGNSISSSLLPMLDKHADVAPHSRYVATECVPLARLDEVAREQVTAASRPFLKVDTQGYEAAVLDGAAGILDRFVAVELEMSLAPLYGGQMLMLETVDRMRESGFRLAGLSSGLWDDESGETLQADGIFLRDAAPSSSG